MSEKMFEYKVEVEIAADGKDIDMNEFVRAIFQRTIQGMLSAIRIPDDSKEITLKVSLKR